MADKNRSSDLWIESHQQLGQHPKMRRCARMLGISHVQMVGHLHFLWWWALDFATEGDVSSYDAFDIAEAAMWEGDAETFYRALCDCGWLDGGHLHDWHDYTHRLIEGRQKAAERQQRWRERQRNGDEPTTPTPVSNKETSRNGHVTVMSPSHNVLTVTVTDTTTVTDSDLEGEVVLNPTPAGADAPLPRNTALKAVPKTTPAERREAVRVQILSPPVLEWAAEHVPFIAVADEAEKFLDYLAANGKAQKDYVAAFRNWLRKAKEFAPAQKGHSNGSTSVRLSAAEREEANLRAIAEQRALRQGGGTGGQNPHGVQPADAHPGGAGGEGHIVDGRFRAGAGGADRRGLPPGTPAA